MKIAVITANFGNIDSIKPLPKQTVDFDYFCYDKPDLLSHIGNDRLRSKFPKLCSHLLHPEHDIFIWIDGRVEITSERFVEKFSSELKNCDLFIARHNKRKTILEEFDYVQNNLNQGSEYLKVRYRIEDIAAARARFNDDATLYACGIFSRRNDDATNIAFQDIWLKCCQYGCFEQPWFSWKGYNLFTSSIDFENEYFKLNKHRPVIEKPMKHQDLIQFLIDRHGYKSYLEIGVETRACIDRIHCQKKVGVDPDPNAKAIKMTSDAFFAQNRERFDIILVDGLHEQEQVKRDIANALSALKEGGVVVVHDCNPMIEELQAMQNHGKIWTGDVWKAFVSYRANPELEMYVIDIDYGCGIIRKGKQEPREFGPLEWNAFNRNRREWLNLVSIDDFVRKYG